MKRWSGLAAALVRGVRAKTTTISSLGVARRKSSFSSRAAAPATAASSTSICRFPPRLLIFLIICSFHRALSLSSISTSTKNPKSKERPIRSSNCNNALKKGEELESFTNLLTKPVTALQGIGPVHEAQLSSLKLRTIADMAKYKYFHLARALLTLSRVEEEMDSTTTAKEDQRGHRFMNVNEGLDKAYETWSFRELVDKAPPSALQGLSATAGQTLTEMGVNTIGDLAHWKFCLWAEAIEVAHKYEEEEEVQSAVMDDSDDEKKEGK